MKRLSKLMDMRGRRVLVTGASGGLGRVLTDALAELGADLVLVDLPDTNCEDLALDLSGRHGIIAKSYVCDLEKSEQRVSLIKHVLQDGCLNVLVNNAAFVGASNLSGWGETFENQSEETWRRALEVNLTSVFHLSQLLAPTLRACPGGAIINIASIYGQWGPDWSLYEGTDMANPAAYAASKGGVIQLTRWLATTLAPSIRVNTISPGGVARGQPARFVRAYEKRTPLGRMAVEDDFRGAIAYLASDLSRYVTGQLLAVDGGWGTW